MSPKWRIEFTPAAETDIARFDKATRERIIEKLEWLETNFENILPLPLSSQWRGFFKLRSGAWRVIYRIDYKNKIIIVHYLDHRSKVYKRKS